MTFLSKLGLYGLESIEEPFLAGLVTGDPVLLIGNHGSGKTSLVEAISAALGETFWAYDASKALFEDVIGFPDPSSLAKGLCQYVPTQISIWDKSFILVDEISRAAPSMQSKWLEIIRSRRVMGLSANKLKYVFAAMNPLHYDGSYPLDPALAGRFAFVIQMPEAFEMSKENILAIVRSRHNGDAPALKRDHPSKQGCSCGSELKQVLGQAQGIFPEMEKRLFQQVGNFLARFNNILTDRERSLTLDARRLGMMFRSILATLSLRQAMANYTGTSSPNIGLPEGEELYSIIKNLLPYAAMNQEPVQATAVMSATALALKTTAHPVSKIYGDLLEEGLSLLKKDSFIDKERLHHIVNSALSELGHNDLTKRVNAVLYLALLGPIVANDSNFPLPPNLKTRLLKEWRYLTSIPMSIRKDSDFGPLLIDMEHEAEESNLPLILALHITQEKYEQSTSLTVHPERVKPVYRQLREKMKELEILLSR